MATTQFRIDANAYLGHNYSSFRDKLFSLAIANPSQYFKIREEVVKKVKETAVKNLYETIYDVMNDGTIATLNVGAKNPIVTVVPAATFDFKPQVPPQKINEVSLSIAKTLDKCLDSVLETIIPIDYHSIAAKRLAVTGEAAAMAGNA